MTIPYWSDFVPNSTFYRILRGFHRTFAKSAACRQGTLPPHGTWSHPFGTLIWLLFYLLRPILFRTCHYLFGLCSSNIPRYFLDFASLCNALYIISFSIAYIIYWLGIFFLSLFRCLTLLISVSQYDNYCIYHLHFMKSEKGSECMFWQYTEPVSL